MPVIGGCNDDGVNVLPVENPAEVADGVRPVTARFLHKDLRPGSLMVVHIADDRAIHLGVCKKSGQVSATHPATADESYAHPVVCAEHSLRQHARRHHEPAYLRRPTEQLTSRDLLHNLTSDAFGPEFAAVGRNPAQNGV